MLADLPILGISGWSGSGKTTLIEAVIPRLRAQGLDVAVVKHDVHRIHVDHPGKDSDRFFQAGSDVFLQSPAESLLRTHGSSEQYLEYDLRRLAYQYDVVLVEGHKESPLPKVWLEGPDGRDPPASVGSIMTRLSRDCDRVEALIGILENWLPTQWRRTPVYACVLIGGRSRRMGTPKHLLLRDGVTWLQRTMDMLHEAVREVVIAGGGDIPDALSDSIRLVDAPDARGPMAGLLAAMRWAPDASWLVAACDLPRLSQPALQWLLDTRAPGVWATMPSLEHGPEPLLAHYDPRARSLLERPAGQGNYALRDVAASTKVIQPSPASHLQESWMNVNTEVELREIDPG